MVWAAPVPAREVLVVSVALVEARIVCLTARRLPACRQEEWWMASVEAVEALAAWEVPVEALEVPAVVWAASVQWARRAAVRAVVAAHKVLACRQEE